MSFYCTVFFLNTTTRVVRVKKGETAICPVYRNCYCPGSTNSKKNGYKLSAQWFLGSFGWTSVTCTCDWLMVALNTIDQSSLVAPKAGQKSLYPFPLLIVEWRITPPWCKSLDDWYRQTPVRWKRSSDQRIAAAWYYDISPLRSRESLSISFIIYSSLQKLASHWTLRYVCRKIN